MQELQCNITDGAIKRKLGSISCQFLSPGGSMSPRYVFNCYLMKNRILWTTKHFTRWNILTSYWAWKQVDLLRPQSKHNNHCVFVLRVRDFLTREGLWDQIRVRSEFRDVELSETAILFLEFIFHLLLMWCWFQLRCSIWHIFARYAERFRKRKRNMRFQSNF